MKIVRDLHRGLFLEYRIRKFFNPPFVHRVQQNEHCAA